MVEVSVDVKVQCAPLLDKSPSNPSAAFEMLPPVTVEPLLQTVPSL